MIQHPECRVQETMQMVWITFFAFEKKNEIWNLDFLEKTSYP